MLQHKGWVECLTTVGQGTRFNLYLPRITTAAKRKSGTTSWLSRQPAEIPESPTPQTRPATILLVDDEEMIRTIAKIVLENAGMTILEASDGDECVDLYKLHADQIDLVILDLTMPRVSGREACRKIRAVNPRARVLFSSGFSSEDVEPEDGAIGLLAKPYRPDDLLQAVQLALRNDPDPG
jgi:CheY-like chemotaxis protein